MNKLKKYKLLYFLLVVLLGTAVSCQTSDNNDNTNENTNETTTANNETGDQTTITFAVNGWERGLYQERVKAFEEAHPDIKIELVSTDEIMGNQGNPNSVSVTLGGPDDTLMQLVQGADIISWYIQPGFITDGLLLDLAPLMAGDDNFDAADYYPGTLGQYQWDGGTWGIPTTAGYSLIFYDKDLFDKAGIDYPESGWTWDDLLAAAQDLTLRDGDEVTQWGFTYQYMGPFDLVQAKVGPIFDLTSNPPTARLEDLEVIAAFQWVADLHEKYEVAPYAKPPESEEDAAAYEEMFRLMDEGKVAMWPEQSEAYQWRSQERNIGVVPFPVGPENDQSSPMMNWGGSVLAVSAGTAYPQAAWEWIKFLTEQQGDNEFAFGSGGPTSLPARKSVAEASGVWDKLDDELAEALRFAVEHGFTVVYPPAGGEELYQAIDLIVAEGKAAADVMAAAQESFEKGMEELVSERGKATPIPEFTVAEPPSSQIEEGDTVVRFVVAGGDPSVFREVAREFNESHPDIVVKVEEPNFFTDEPTLQTMIGDADAFQWWGVVSSAEDLQMVLPLQPLLDADPDLSEDDFFPATLDRFRDQGQIMGLPAEVQIAFLSYNKRLFDAAGLDYPQPGWTMDEFLETAVALTQGENEDDKIYGYVPDLYEIGDMMTFVTRQGVSFIDESVDPPTLNFADPDTIAALHWYTNLTTEYKVKPVFDMTAFGPNSNPYEDRQAMVEHDRAAIWKGDQYGIMIAYDENGQPIGDDQDTSHIGYVPYPVGPGGSAGFESVNGYYISAQTEVRQAAWEWLKYLTAQESLSQFGLPARISAAESEEFAQLVGAEKADVMISSVKNSTAASGGDLYMQGSDWLGPALGISLQEAYDNIIAEEATVEEALQTAQEKTDNYRQCIIQNDLVGSNDYQEFEACLEEADLSWNSY